MCQRLSVARPSFKAISISLFGIPLAKSFSVKIISKD
jgi:hypothetical protein